ncbi:MAG: DUF1868 domain-containing protein [Pseudomonadota bacterium]
MRDRERRYLAGRLQGGRRPAHIGRKFTPDGQALSCPGITTLAHVPKDSGAHAALVEAQAALAAAPGADAFTFLPPESFHMTLFDGVIDYRRTEGEWIVDLPLDAEMAEVRDAARQRLRRLTTVPREVRVRPTGIFGGFSVEMTGADTGEEARLRRGRDAISAALGLRRPDHDAYPFHITLGYLLRWLAPVEIEEVIARSQTAAETLIARAPVFTLGPFELCAFEDMRHFAPMMRLGDRPTTHVWR